MAEFEPAHKLTSLNEGGYTDDRDDAGNWTGGRIGSGLLIGTKYGISAPVLCAYLRKDATVDQMRNLTQSIAREIYEVNYWKKIRGAEITSQDAANSIYDSAVNMGVVTAIKLAQKALGVPQTGAMDVVTLNALNHKQ